MLKVCSMGNGDARNRLDASVASLGIIVASHSPSGGGSPWSQNRKIANSEPKNNKRSELPKIILHARCKLCMRNVTAVPPGAGPWCQVDNDIGERVARKELAVSLRHAAFLMLRKELENGVS